MPQIRQRSVVLPLDDDSLSAVKSQSLSDRRSIALRGQPAAVRPAGLAQGGKQPTVVSVLINPFDTGTLYAGTTDLGVFKTIDSGENWSPANSGLGDLRITGMALDSIDPEIIYAGTDGSSIFASYDGAQTWY